MNNVSSSTKNLGEQAYEALREAIITLELEPGQTIFENEIASQLSISRTPTRDAFKLLISEGLIEVTPQRTKKVVRISESKVKESGFVRLSLETSAFKLVATNWQSTKVYETAEREMKRILQQQREAAEDQDMKLFLQWDEAFHNRILQLAGNETLQGVIYHMRGHLNRFRYLAMRELVLTEDLIVDHEQLFTSLTNKEEKKVEELLKRHLTKYHAEIPRLREQFSTYFTD